MNVLIGHASIDENGRLSGGKVGDQTKKEICIRNWYSKPWNIYLECIDQSIADKAADYMMEICADDNFGYDQSERLTGYYSIVGNKGKVKGAKGEFDCSSLVASCYRMAGIDIPPSCTTRNLRKILLETGQFVALQYPYKLNSANTAKRGGIYLKEGSHVVMVVSVSKVKTTNPYPTPTVTVSKKTKGDVVKWVQWELAQAGYELSVDGSYGNITENHVKDYQKKNKLEIDGIVGPKTRNVLLTT